MASTTATVNTVTVSTRATVFSGTVFSATVFSGTVFSGTVSSGAAAGRAWTSTAATKGDGGGSRFDDDENPSRPRRGAARGSEAVGYPERDALSRRARPRREPGRDREPVRDRDRDGYSAEPSGSYSSPASRDSYAESPSASGLRSRRRAAASDPEDERDSGRFSLVDDEDDEDGNGEGGGRGGERKPKQRRAFTCLVVFLFFAVLAGGMGFGVFKAYSWYQGKYGPAPDYVSAVGTGEKVPVTIPSGSGGTTIGGLLFNAGIVKSQRAFSDACKANISVRNIQAGTYLLTKGLSASAAITALLNPKNQDSKTQLITYGGERAGQIFAALEAKTGWKDADIRAAISGGGIGLPSWATPSRGRSTPTPISRASSPRRRTC